MADFNLKDLGIVHKDLKAACASFNSAGLVKDKIKLIGITGEAMLVLLLKHIDTLDADNVAKIPADVKALYDALPDSVFNQQVDPAIMAGVDVIPVDTTRVAIDEDAIDAAHQSECPVYLKGWNPKDQVCITCKKDFHKDYVNCKRTVKGITTVKDKKSEKKGSKPRLAPRVSSSMLTRYGHRINTMAGLVDDLVWKGTHFDEIVKGLMKWHGRDENSAKGKAKGHISHLINTCGLKISNTNGVFKAEEEYVITQSTQNTAPAEPSVEQ